MNPALRKWLLRAVGLIVLLGLLGWALHKAPLAEIGSALLRLQSWQVAVMLVINTLIYILVTLRWWIIVRAEARQVPYLPLLGVRVSVFGISYFTFGPQVGGEPLQVLSLQRKYGLSYTRAAASVLLDKLLELLVDFVLLAVGVTAILQAGLLAESRAQWSIGFACLAALVLIPISHLVFLYHRHYPLTWLLRNLPFLPHRAKPVRFLCAAERMAGMFCQRHPRALLAALGVSLMVGTGMLADYILMAGFLGIRLSFWKIVAGWTAGWLAFLFPLPGGLGALESSQVFALGAFGIPAAMALSLTLLMRGRDLLIGGLGLLLAGRGISAGKKSTITP